MYPRHNKHTHKPQKREGKKHSDCTYTILCSLLPFVKKNLLLFLSTTCRLKKLVKNNIYIYMYMVSL